MPRPGALLISHSDDDGPATQGRRERALLAGAARGEIRLHVSAMRGSVLALGAFHRAPRPCGDPTAIWWRRRTGGCATACGEGFALVTIALPHRSALVADERLALRPEQVMNRCVRGILAWLRRLGLDPLYPGLDAVTVDRRTLARLGFAETHAGPTLFQAILAGNESFADTAALLDRLDPEGRVPLRLQGRDELTSLAQLGRWADVATDRATLTRHLAEAYAATFPTAIGEVVELDPEAASQPTGADPAETPPDLGPPELEGTAVVEHGVLGQVAALARVTASRVTTIAVTGDFIAPDGALAALGERIGEVRDAPGVRALVREIFDGNRTYLLGLAPAALERLIARAIAEAS